MDKVSDLVLEYFPNVSRETIMKLEQYSELIQKWNSKINLISQHCREEELFTRHILDSLQLIEYIDNKDALITDLGSGGGFPGLVLAIAGHKCKLVESNIKKSTFLKEVIIKLNINSIVKNQRFTDLKGYKSDYIVSRAVGDISYLLKESEEILSNNTICFFHKSKYQIGEIKGLKKFWSFEYDTYQNRFNSEGIILKIYNLKKWQK